jgi:hypothetical protein
VQGSCTAAGAVTAFPCIKTATWSRPAVRPAVKRLALPCGNAATALIVVQHALHCTLQAKLRHHAPCTLHMNMYFWLQGLSSQPHASGEPVRCVQLATPQFSPPSLLSGWLTFWPFSVYTPQLEYLCATRPQAGR